MVLTRECDYALRILRTLADGQQRTVGELSERDLIPKPFAYKITKKLARGKLIDITRGVDGGCRLCADLSRVSLYDLMVLMEDSLTMSVCCEEGFTCSWCARNGFCRIHANLAGIEGRLSDILSGYSILSLFQ